MGMTAGPLLPARHPVVLLRLEALLRPRACPLASMTPSRTLEEVACRHQADPAPARHLGPRALRSLCRIAWPRSDPDEEAAYPVRPWTLVPRAGVDVAPRKPSLLGALSSSAVAPPPSSCPSCLSCSPYSAYLALQPCKRSLTCPSLAPLATLSHLSHDVRAIEPSVLVRGRFFSTRNSEPQHSPPAFIRHTVHCNRNNPVRSHCVRLRAFLTHTSA